MGILTKNAKDIVPCRLEALDRNLGGLVRGGINTLVFKESTLKNEIIFGIVQSSLARDEVVIILDLDNQITPLLEDRSAEIQFDGLVLLQPNSENLEDILVRLCSSAKPRSLIVLDSVLLFYHALGEGLAFDALNRRLGLDLHLLRTYSSRVKSVVLVTSMLRARRNSTDRRNEWTMATVGGRFLKEMSDIVARVERVNGELKVDVLKPFS